MTKFSYYQIPTKPKRRKSGFFYFIIFILSLLMIGIAFYFTIKYQDFRQIYQATIEQNQLGAVNQQEAKLLLINLAYPDPGRLEGKRVSGLSILSIEEGDLQAQILNPDIYLNSETLSKYPDLAFTEQLIEQVESVLNLDITYYLIYDFEKFYPIFDQFPGQKIQFSQNYQMEKFNFKAGHIEEMTSRLAQHLLLKDKNETQESYGRRQLDLLSQTYGHWSKSLLSQDFSKFSKELYQHSLTNVPYEVWFRFCLSQLFNNHFQINTFK